MNYKKIYDNIISNRQQYPIDIGYVEVHHIIPRSLGGADTKKNLVRLSAREHFICHLLLVKIHINTSNYFKMVKAFMMMMFCKSSNQFRYTSKNYAWLKEEFSKVQSKLQTGNGNSQFGTRWISSDELKISKKIMKFDQLPLGWTEGRILNFDKHVEKKASQLIKQEDKRKRLEEKTKQYSEWYKIYKDVGFTKFCEITGYDKTIENFVQTCAKLVLDFKPQNGKRRGK